MCELAFSRTEFLLKSFPLDRKRQLPKEVELSVLVIGGAGYIGSHAAHALKRKGYEVIIYDNLSTGHTSLADETPRLPVNPYGASKLAFEHALEAYDRAYGLRFVSFRYFNASGADETGQIGEIHNPETHLIPAAFEAIHGERGVLEIYGDDYPTPDGTCIRDYIHVNDLAEAHVLGLEHLHGGKSAE